MTTALRPLRAMAVVLLVAFGVAACSRKPAASPASAQPSGSASPAAPATASPAPAAAAPPLSFEARSGRETYRHYCQTCHGESGAGDGFNAFNLDPHPRDLADPAFQKKSDADIRDAIRRGGAGVGLSPLMPPWGRTLGDRKIDDVILYLRTLRRPS